MMRTLAALLALLLIPCAARADSPFPPPITLNVTTAVTTATTTQVIAGSTGYRTFIYLAGVQATATESAANVTWEYGTGTTCTTPTTLTANSAILPVTNQNFTMLWSASGVANAAGGYAPSVYPLIIPSGASVCVLSSGTTIAFAAFAYFAQGP